MPLLLPLLPSHMARPRRNSKEASTAVPEILEQAENFNETEKVAAVESTLAALTEAASETSIKAPTNPTTTTTTASQSQPADGRRRSLSIAEIISLAASKAVRPLQPASNDTTAAVDNLNLPESLRAGLMKADSPILNALLPLIRQKLAAKTAEAVRRASVDGSPTLSTSSRRSSTSSRSEDHRNSHKLAERKRRREMKDVFDALRDCLPPGARKSSKWEILMEAADEIDKLLDTENELLKRRDKLVSSLKQKQ